MSRSSDEREPGEVLDTDVDGAWRSCARVVCEARYAYGLTRTEDAGRLRFCVFHSRLSLGRLGGFCERALLCRDHVRRRVGGRDGERLVHGR